MSTVHVYLQKGHSDNSKKEGMIIKKSSKYKPA